MVNYNAIDNVVAEKNIYVLVTMKNIRNTFSTKPDSKVQICTIPVIQIQSKDMFILAVKKNWCLF